MSESPGCVQRSARESPGDLASVSVPLRFWRFCVVGAIGFFVDVATLYAVMGLAGMGPIPARVPAFLVAATFTWIANRVFTFGPSNRHPFLEWMRFLFANSLGSTVNFLVYVLVLYLIPAAYGAPAIAVACGSIAGLLFNFVVSQVYVFSRAR